MANPIKYSDLFDNLGPGSEDLKDFTSAVQALNRNYKNFAKGLEGDGERVKTVLTALTVQAGTLKEQAAGINLVNEKERASMAALAVEAQKLAVERQRLESVLAAQAKAQRVVTDATKEAQTALRAMQNELRESFAAGDTARAEKAAAAILKYKAETLDLSRAIRGTNSELTAARGSYDALVLENAKLIASLRGLKDGVDDGGEAATRLQKQIADNTQKLKTFDESILIFSRNVGNYKDGFAPLVQELAKLQAAQRGLSEDSQQYQALEQKRIGFLTAAQKAAAQAGLSYEQANAKIESYTAAIQPTVNNLVRLEKAQQEVAKSAGADSEEYRKLGFQIQSTQKQLENLPPPIDQAGESFGNLRQELGFTKEALVSAVLQLGAGAVGFQAIVGGVSAAFADDSEFQSALSSLSALTGATGEDLQFLANKAEELGPVVGKSAAETLKAFELIGSAKPELLKSKEELADFTAQVLLLAAASGEELPDAAEALTGVMNQFQAPAAEATRYINALAAGAKEGAATIPQTAAALKYFGVNAASANISVEKSVALIQTLAERSIKGEQAGTQLRNILAKLASGAKETNPEVVGLTTALDNLGKQNLSTAQYTKLFGLENANTAKVLVENRAKVEDLTTAVTGTSVANEQAAKQLDNIATAGSRFAAVIKNVVINNLDGLSRAFGRLLNGASDIIQRLTGVTKSFEENIDTSVRVAQANTAVANTAQGLLTRYQDLTAKGVKPATDGKGELNIITQQLRTTLGESVVSIDKETGALVLNAEAVKAAIKQKLLLANQETSSLALRANAALEEQKRAQFEEGSARLQLATAGELLKTQGLTVAGAEKLYQLSVERGGRVLGYSAEQIAAADNYLATQQKVTTAVQAGNEATDRYNLALEALKKLGFSAADIQRLFAGATDKATDAQNGLGAAVSETTRILDRTAKARAADARQDLQIQLSNTERAIAGIKKVQEEQNKLFEDRQISQAVFRASVATTQDQINDLEYKAAVTRIGIARKERDEKLIAINDTATKSKRAKGVTTEEIADINAAATIEAQTVRKAYLAAKKKAEADFSDKLEVKPLEFSTGNKSLELYSNQVREFVETYAYESEQIRNAETARESELVGQLARREITQKQYDERASKNQLDAANKLVALDNKYHRATLDSQKAANEKALAEQRRVVAERIKTIETIGQYTQQAEGAFFAIKGNFIDADIQRTQEAYDHDLAAAGDNAALKAKIQADYDKRLKKLNYDKAKAERDQAAISVAISTAVAVAKAFAEYVFPFALIPAGIALAEGALQEAVILSKPLPSYFKGRENGPAEIANLGEQGPELVGQPGTFRLVSKPTVGLLAAGDKVITAPKTKDILAQNELVEGRLVQRQHSQDMERQTVRLRSSAAAQQAQAEHASQLATSQTLHKLEQIRRTIESQEQLRVTENGLERWKRSGDTWQRFVNERYLLK